MRDLIRDSKKHRDLFIEIIAVTTVILLWEVLTTGPVF